MTAMQQLSGLDATFLYLETPEMPMHVGALHLYELPAGYKGKFVTAVRQHIRDRLPATPALRRRLWWMPLNMANPAWVDAEPDLRVHVVAGSCPKGAGLPELEAAVSRLHTQLLDRQRPLWRFFVFEGLAPGPKGERRAAIYTQLHHAAVDGQAAVALANALLDLGPQPRRLDQRPSRRQKVFKLEMAEMLRGVIASQATKIAGIIRELPSTVGTLKDAAAQAISHASLLTGRKGSGNITLAPATPFNVSVTAGRAFAAVTLPLPAVRELGHAHDATLNEMVLMLCSSALRRHFGKRRQLPRKSMVAAVPITLRASGDTSPDNQASMSLVSLGTHIADPVKRLAHVKAASAAMKSTMGSLKSILPTDFPSLGVPWLLEAATALYGKARVADRIPQVANLVISNVPGPHVPLYMAGAKMLTNYPTSIVVHGLALNITVQSYDQSLDFGLMADAQALPEVRELADAIRVAWDDLLALPRSGDPDHADAAESLVGRAQRAVTGVVTGAVTGAVGKVTQRVVGSAIEGAVSQVTGRLGVRPAKKPARRR
ncbi:MAG: wax ester/triacylglycerol synthase family O-acyltransferase [Rubrivivax sp.]|nr:wax ester/triacylglycerol synthase family O-acyltransferase [Rubrivivax sp.]